MSDSLPNTILGLLNSGIVVLNAQSNIVTWNAWMEEHSGFSASDVLNKSIYEIVPEIKGSRIERAINKAIDFNCPSILSAKLIDASFPLFRVQVISRSKGERLVQSILIKPFETDEDGQHCVISIADISTSDRRESALRHQSDFLSKLVEQLKEKDHQLRMLFEHAQNGILIFDNTGTIISQNPSVERMVRIENLNLEGENIAHVIEAFSTQLGGFSEANMDKLLGEQEKEFESILQVENSNPVEIAFTINSIPEVEDKQYYFSFFRDIGAEKAAERRLIRLAKYDALTDLPNRTLFYEILDRAIASHAKDNQKFNVFFIDLDKFKSVNDTYGHAFGDEFLKKIGQRLQSTCRSSDIVSRWSGDEFVLLFEKEGNNRSAISIAEKLIELVAQPIEIDGSKIIPSCSIGIASYPNDADSAELLIKHADNAMYQAKADGRNRFRFFTQEMNEVMMYRLSLERELAQAIENDEFVLHYQPQISIKTGEINGVEVLLRWQHPEQGLLYPKEFLHIAEESLLVKDIGNWVFKNAIEAAARWLNAKGDTISISINVAAVQFKDVDIIPNLLQIITSVGISPKNIILEITESALLEDSTMVINQINSLKALGIRIALDDFGTGYSSLSYLRKLPIDILKIDRSFLEDSTNDKVSAHIISAIVELSHALNLDVVAEGIETKEQLELLQLENCDKAQGFYLAKPMDFQQLSNWFDTHNVLSMAKYKG